jgi:hypothetical protein
MLMQCHLLYPRLSHAVIVAGQSLQDAGLNLSEEGLQFKLRDDQPNPDQQQSQHGSGEDREGGTASTSIAAGSSEETTGWVKPDAILDVSV